MWLHISRWMSSSHPSTLTSQPPEPRRSASRDGPLEAHLTCAQARLKSDPVSVRCSEKHNYRCISKKKIRILWKSSFSPLITELKKLKLSSVLDSFNTKWIISGLFCFDLDNYGLRLVKIKKSNNTWSGLFLPRNYCISAAWQGRNQPAVPLRCYRSPGCFDSLVSHLFLLKYLMLCV